MRKILILLAKLRYCWNSSRLKELHLVSLVGIMKNSDSFVKYFQTKCFSIFFLLITFPRICFVCGLLSEG